MFVQARTQRTGIFRDAVRSRGQETIQAPCGQSRMVKPSRFLPVHTEKVLSAWSRVPAGLLGAAAAWWYTAFCSRWTECPAGLAWRLSRLCLPSLRPFSPSFIPSCLPSRPTVYHSPPLVQIAERQREREVIARRRSVGKGRFR